MNSLNYGLNGWRRARRGIDDGGRVRRRWRCSRLPPLIPSQPNQGEGPRRRWYAAGVPINDEEGPTRTNSGGYGVDSSGCIIIVLWVMQVSSIGMTGPQILPSRSHAAMLSPSERDAKVYKGTNIHGKIFHHWGESEGGYYGKNRR